MIFFDTSYLARPYLDDHGCAEVRALAACHPLVAAIHGRIELVAALHRAYRERRYSEPVFRALIRQFQSDCAAGGFTWLPLSSEVFDRAEDAYLDVPASVFLRAADALHLACARQHGFTEVYSHDRHLLDSATLFEVKGVNVIP